MLRKLLEDGIGGLQTLFELATLVEVEELLEEAGLARWEDLFVCEGLGHYYRVERSERQVSERLITSVHPSTLRNTEIYSRRGSKPNHYGHWLRSDAGS